MTTSVSAVTRRELVAIVGDDHVLTDRDLTAGYEVDWTGRFRGSTPLVVRPGSTAEVAAVVQMCARRSVALVLQGGNTGLVGGSVPLAGEVVLSTRRLSGVVDVDADAGRLTAGSGTTIAAVQTAARDAGWAYGVDWAARGSATLGGSVATNAGGLRVVRYGSTRAQVLGVEAVLGSGAVLDDLGRLDKDATGFDLSGLLCGSEGTLGVITAARLRLVPHQPDRAVTVVGLRSLEAAVAAVGQLRRVLPGLEAAEAYRAAESELVARHLDVAPILRPAPPITLVVECAGSGGQADLLASAVDSLDDVIDAVIADDGPRRASLWRHREALTEAIATLGPHHKLDVSLPVGALGQFAEEVVMRVKVAAPQSATWIFGHLGDGNLHVNVTGVAPDDDAVDDAVLSLVLDHRGSISAEHGVGAAKRAWVARQRGPTAMGAMRAIKGALDPHGVLNPNVLL